MKLTKPFKVPTLSRNMSLETFIKQLETWSEINEKVLEFMKIYDIMESLKQNKDIRDLPCYVAEHVLPVLEKKTDQTIKKALKLLKVKYRRSHMEKIEECVDDMLRFGEDQYEDNGELILAMKEIRRRETELNITRDE